ncbi:hypothetical protein A0J48_000345 [Sphaerospermopsis aphanizomenoides BCCUSP55]|uniref:hypothetical protein n=1 Tax=Sphaerospermopsis aphanizomenoides TaxID=459663 RepID=UPI001907F2B7|nr:hypothetical protein [Sphaerospermopsis aphanizomenoides]MBK1986013.1 hypothetical protein [Sphaerospermopsis aphanizomenoides BCCUSP55]
MNTINKERKPLLRLPAILLSALLTMPLFTSCSGGSRTASPPPPVDDTAGRTVSQTTPVNQPQAKKGLSTGQKVAILAGAAALYYLYNQHKNAQGTGAQGKYYLSKNGRVYYRDAEGRAHWVTPPPEGIRVPESEAQQYRDFQGYNGRTTGRDLTQVPATAPGL